MLFFFFNDTATTEIYTLSLHDALPISRQEVGRAQARREARPREAGPGPQALGEGARPEEDRRQAHLEEGVLTVAKRSEEHTSELQSRQYLVCRLLLEKKKIIYNKCNRQ